VGTGLVVVLFVVVGSWVALAMERSYRELTRSWHWKQCQRMKATPIAQTAAGPARIEGVVVSARAATTPFTRLPAVWFESELQPYTAASREAQSFAVKDDSGLAQVQLEEAEELELIVRDEFHRLTGDDDLRELRERYPAIAELERRQGLKDLVVRQRRLAPGDRVTVFAQAGWEAASEGDSASYREAPRRLVMRPLRGRIFVFAVRN
jgi:hypothetical protein